MILYLLRHGIAEEHGSQTSDEARKLVQEGKDKTRDAMKSLAKMKYPVPSLVISSSLIRAKETAEIAIEFFAPDAKYKMSDALRPMSDVIDTMALVHEYIREYRTIMLVGHEPHLSSFGSALLGAPHPVIEMKKSSIALFEILRNEVPRMRGTLTALFPPRIGSL